MKLANTSDTEAWFWEFHLSNSNDIVSTIIYDNIDDFDSDIVSFLFYIVMFQIIHLFEFIYFSVLNLLEHLAMLQTSTLAINF